LDRYQSAFTVSWPLRAVLTIPGKVSRLYTISREVSTIDTTRLPAPAFRILSEHVADTLGQVILSGRYKPGDRLIEQELADELGVSRAPVRDALRVLARRGLVTLVPHRGAMVTAISPELVIDAFAVRAVLEGMAARLATERLTAANLAYLGTLIDAMRRAGAEERLARLVELDVEFHRVLTVSCQRPVLLEALQTIANKTYFLIAASRYACPLDRVADLHRAIFEAVQARDPDLVEAVVKDHIAYGQRQLLKSALSAQDAQDAS
jgi:DNA-binding GntR family transcriptional regulator